MSDGRGADVHSQLAHHFCGRSLDGLASDDRRNRDDWSVTMQQSVTHAGHSQNWGDADERVRRAYHHRSQRRLRQSSYKIFMRAREGRAFKGKILDLGPALLFDEISLK